jgi:hypothetical protein
MVFFAWAPYRARAGIRQPPIPTALNRSTRAPIPRLQEGFAGWLGEGSVFGRLRFFFDGGVLAVLASGAIQVELRRCLDRREVRKRISRACPESGVRRSADGFRLFPGQRAGLRGEHPRSGAEAAPLHGRRKGIIMGQDEHPDLHAGGPFCDTRGGYSATGRPSSARWAGATERVFASAVLRGSSRTRFDVHPYRTPIRLTRLEEHTIAVHRRINGGVNLGVLTRYRSSPR